MCLPDHLPDTARTTRKRLGAVAKTEFPPTTGTDDERSGEEDSDSSSRAENAPAHEEDSSIVDTDTSAGAPTSVPDADERGLVASASSYV